MKSAFNILSPSLFKAFLCVLLIVNLKMAAGVAELLFLWLSNFTSHKNVLQRQGKTKVSMFAPMLLLLERASECVYKGLLLQFSLMESLLLCMCISQFSSFQVSALCSVFV